MVKTCKCYRFMGILMAKAGRPSKFTQEIADQICDLMIAGSDLVDVCETLKLNRRTVYRWMHENPDFDAQCARAREALTEFRLKKIRDKIEAAQKDGVDPHLLKIQVAFEQWEAEKIAPRYAKRTEVTGKDGGPIKVQKTIDLSHLSDEELEVLDLALNGADDGDEDDE
jgi:hypothetical protein